MMKYKPILGLIIISIFSSLVFASDNAPPALPSEYWGTVTDNGNPATDGLAMVAEVDGVDYTQENPVTFNNGMYNIMLVGGDRELTYLDDPTCATHWAADEACVPCSTNQADEDYCIEGPQDEAKVTIKIDGKEAMPYVGWFNGSVNNLNIVTPLGDWDQKGCVDMVDFGYFANHYGEVCGDPGWDPIYDLYWDCIIDMTDAGYFINNYGQGCGG